MIPKIEQVGGKKEEGERESVRKEGGGTG